jgi:DNA primase catalytic core
MPRIPESEIERIKKETDLAALVRSRGIELKQHGERNLIGRCPFHDDHDPSFVVTPAKGLFHCLGCGVAGNAIQFVERFDKISFRHAFELLAEGSPVVFTQKPKRLENPFDPEATDAELMEQVVDYYHERLLKTPAALDYLKKRGLNNEAALRAFRIGFADRSLGLRLPEKNRVEGKAIRERLQKLGIIRASGHEHFNGSITVPILDGQGRPVEMYGRKITSNLRKGTPLHLYLPGAHAGIWNARALDHPEVILCEAPLDAVTFVLNGFENATFIYGTQGFTDELFEALIEHKVRTVRLAYDNDDAGNRSAARDAERLAAVGIEVYRIKFPHGMDANEYALKVKPPDKALESVVRSAEWLAGASSRAPSSLVALAAKEKTPDPVDPVNPVQNSPELTRTGDYHVLELGSRHYRVGGLDKNNSLEVMKITLRLRVVESKGQGSALFHLDSFDLCRDGDRRRFIERAAEETRLEKELIKRDLGKLLFALEDAQQARLNAALTDNQQPIAELTSAEREEALSFLKSPDLVAKIEAAFDDCGLVGESINRLAAYLACTSRKCPRPLAVIIQSTSAAGKSTLMDAVLAMFPNEEQIKYSAMTGQSLYYLGETNIKHRILAIVEEEGAEKASYALKLLQSEGELTIASTGKDANTGRMETQEYHVEGPVMIFLTTTAIDIDEELQNRCLTLTVDESREQTERIHALQRQARTLDGLRLRRRRTKMLALMQNVQRLLEPVDIVNPWADRLTFTAGRTRTRRDHEKYLTLIDAVALLHQHQRRQMPVSKSSDVGAKPYIEVTLEDIELANRLAPELLGRSLDELPPQTRRVLEAVKQIVRARCDEDEQDQSTALFSRREVRDRLGWSVTQIRTHLERLKDLDYIAARCGRSGSAFQYELLTDCRESGGPDPIGLLDVEKLKVRQQPVGKKVNLSAGCRGGIRQVQPVEKKPLKRNLSACSDRTSGSPVLVES